jgi:hypothetical protein
MKKIYSIVTGILVTASVLAQAPQKMSYQAVIRNSSNALVTSTKVGMRISILKGSATATPSPLTDYVETQTDTTNANGLVSLEIGKGTPVIGAFAGIKWAEGPYFIKTETDPMGGTNYTIIGTNELLSVPYALHAKTAENLSGINTGDQDLSGLATTTTVNSGLATKVDKEAGKGLSPNGTTPGQMNYWNGSAWVMVSPGSEGQIITFCGGVPTWTIGGICPGKIASLDCASATNNGTLTQGNPAISVSSVISYSSGNGGYYSGQTITSTGVTGLTATLQVGSFANGNGTLTYTISGTPASVGTANFAINSGGKSCTLTFTVNPNIPSGQYPAGTVFCNNTPTSVVPVTNPTTGKIWMDRNLGASQVATSSKDAASYGDLYQWGRGADGHQCRTSVTTSTLSTTDVTGNAIFITSNGGNYDWRSTQNDNLWQGVNGLNNPCPSGYRIPTETELNTERASWTADNSIGAFASPLKLPLAGARRNNDGSLADVSGAGNFWSSTIFDNYPRYLGFTTGNAFVFDNFRASGFSVRCIKE